MENGWTLGLRARSQPALGALLVSATLVGFGALGAPQALAQDGARLTPKVDCTCRFSGNDFHIGDSICMRSPQGLRMAVCGMVQNNTSWQFTNTPCPSARLAPKPANMTPALKS